MGRLGLALLAVATLASKTIGLPNRAWSEPYTINSRPGPPNPTLANTTSIVSLTTHVSSTACSRVREGSPGLVLACPDPTSPGKLTTITQPNYKPTKRVEEHGSIDSYSGLSTLTSSAKSHTTHYRVPPTGWPWIGDRSLVKRHDWAMVCKPIEDALGKIDMQKECRDAGYYCDQNGKLIGSKDPGCKEYCDCFNLRTGITKAGCTGRIVKGTQPILNPGNAICGASRRSALLERLSRRSAAAPNSDLVNLRSRLRQEHKLATTKRSVYRRHAWALVCESNYQKGCSELWYCDQRGIMRDRDEIAADTCLHHCNCHNLQTGQTIPGTNDKPPPAPLPHCAPGSKTCGLKKRSTALRIRDHDWAMICDRASQSVYHGLGFFCDSKGVLRKPTEVSFSSDCFHDCDCHNVITGVVNPGFRRIPPPPPFSHCAPGEKTCGLKGLDSSLTRRDPQWGSHNWAMVCSSLALQKRCQPDMYCDRSGVMVVEPWSLVREEPCMEGCDCHNLVTGQTNPGTSGPPPPPSTHCPPWMKICGLKASNISSSLEDHDSMRRSEDPATMSREIPHNWAFVCNNPDSQHFCAPELYCDMNGRMKVQKGTFVDELTCRENCVCHNLVTGDIIPGTAGMAPHPQPPHICHGQKSCSKLENSSTLSSRLPHNWAFICNHRDVQFLCSPAFYCDSAGNIIYRRGSSVPEAGCRQNCICQDLLTGETNPATGLPPSTLPPSTCPLGEKHCLKAENSSTISRRKPHDWEKLEDLLLRGRDHHWAFVCNSLDHQKFCAVDLYCSSNGVMRSKGGSPVSQQFCRANCQCHNLVTGVSNPGTSAEPPPPPGFCDPKSKTCGLKETILNPRHDWAFLCKTYEAQVECGVQFYCISGGVVEARKSGTDSLFCRETCGCYNVVTGVMNPGTNRVPPLPPGGHCPPGSKTCGLKKPTARLSGRQEQKWVCGCDDPVTQKKCAPHIFDELTGDTRNKEDGSDEDLLCRARCGCHLVVAGANSLHTNGLPTRSDSKPSDTSDKFNNPHPLTRRHPWAHICSDKGIQKECNELYYCDGHGNYISKLQGGFPDPHAPPDPDCRLHCGCHNLVTGAYKSGTGKLTPGTSPMCPPGSKTCGLKLTRRHSWAHICSDRDIQKDCDGLYYCDGNGNYVSKLGGELPDPHAPTSSFCRLQCGCHNLVSGAYKSGTGKLTPGTTPMCPPGSKTCGLKRVANELRNDKLNHVVRNDESSSRSLSIHNSFSHPQTTSSAHGLPTTPIPTIHTTIIPLPTSRRPHIPIPISTHRPQPKESSK